MPVPDDSFVTFLRGEIDTAGSSYERARKKVFLLTDSRNFDTGPDLMDALEDLSEATQGYIHALRRLAHYSAHQARRAAPPPLVNHA